MPRTLSRSGSICAAPVVGLPQLVFQTDDLSWLGQESGVNTFKCHTFRNGIVKFLLVGKRRDQPAVLAQFLFSQMIPGLLSYQHCLFLFQTPSITFFFFAFNISASSDASFSFSTGAACSLCRALNIIPHFRFPATACSVSQNYSTFVSCLLSPLFSYLHLIQTG